MLDFPELDGCEALAEPALPCDPVSVGAAINLPPLHELPVSDHDACSDVGLYGGRSRGCTGLLAGFGVGQAVEVAAGLEDVATIAEQAVWDPAWRVGPAKRTSARNVTLLTNFIQPDDQHRYPRP